MTVQYRRHDGTESRRQLEPHRLIHVEGRWYLVAWDLAPADWRTLRLDRLQPRPPWGPRFTPRPVPDEQVRDFTSRSITTAPYPYWCRILAGAPAAEVRSRFGPAVAQVEEAGPDTAVLTTGSTSLAELAGYLATGGFEFSVLDDGDGPALRAALIEVAQRLERAAAPPGP
jgi:predicted DNA-binding transcriptional regulator YafY